LAARDPAILNAPHSDDGDYRLLGCDACRCCGRGLRGEVPSSEAMVRQQDLSESETPTERALRARLAAHASWSKTSDRTFRTAPARQALRDRFEDQVDPDHTLPEAERIKRAESARREHYTRLDLLSVQARRKRKGRT
jgi:hypothetical protein